MKATFLVEVDTGSDTDLLGIADDIVEALGQNGITATSAKPWARPSTTSGVIPSPQAAVPPTTQQ